MTSDIFAFFCLAFFSTAALRFFNNLMYLLLGPYYSTTACALAHYNSQKPLLSVVDKFTRSLLDSSSSSIQHTGRAHWGKSARKAVKSGQQLKRELSHLSSWRYLPPSPVDLYVFIVPHRRRIKRKLPTRNFRMLVWDKGVRGIAFGVVRGTSVTNASPVFPLRYNKLF